MEMSTASAECLPARNKQVAEWFPQISCIILSLAGTATSIIFSTTNILSWQNMSFLVTKVCSSWLFVATNICHDKHNFVATKFCCDKLTFVMTHVCCNKTHLLSWQKYACCDIKISFFVFLVTKVLSQQAYFCLDKGRVLLRQKWYLWQLPPVLYTLISILMTALNSYSKHLYCCKTLHVANMHADTRSCMDINDMPV